MKLDIAFDLDNCLIDFSSGLHKLFEENGYKDVKNDAFEIVTDPDMSKNKRTKFFRQLYKEHYRTPPIKGARELLEILHGRSQQPVFIVTSRPAWCAHYTHELVRSFCLVPYIIAFAPTQYGKSVYLNSINYFVEDRRATICELISRGKKVFKPKWYWNKMEPHPNVREIDSLKDLIPIADDFVIE